MGEIVELAVRRRGQRRRAAAELGPGRVLLFLGVRYERPVEPPTDASPDGTTRRTRRRRRRAP